MQAFLRFGAVLLEFIVQCLQLRAELAPKETIQRVPVVWNSSELMPVADAGVPYATMPRATDVVPDSGIIHRPYETKRSRHAGFDQWPIVHNAERSLKNPNAGSACHALRDYWNIMVPAGQARRDELVVQRMRVLEPRLRELCPYLKPRGEPKAGVGA